MELFVLWQFGFVKSKVFETRNRSLEEIESNLRKRANKAAI
jgi:hypothetical protein